MEERRKEERRKGERRQDIESAQHYVGMQRRLAERRRGERRKRWLGLASSGTRQGLANA